MKKFWLVWVDDTSVNNRKHTSLADAKAGAAQLASKKGCSVTVLEAIEVCSPATNVSWESVSVDTVGS